MAVERRRSLRESAGKILLVFDGLNGGGGLLVLKWLSASKSSGAIVCQWVFGAAMGVAAKLTLLRDRWTTWRRMLMRAEGLGGI